ncbi:dUTP diphosphatase [Bacillus solimangrovi]|nr:dUTP diphosphatase [Bacillus solimangrovi]
MLEKLYSMQRELDKRIKGEHSLQGKLLFDKKILALLVEIGELANETRCFKFWSTKPASSDDMILEEFVDGVHFILSLGIELGLEEEIEINESFNDISLVDQFNNIYAHVDTFRNEKSDESYQQLMTSYFSLGSSLGFTFEQIESAYHAKNEVNHERQDRGY